ncbi:MAG: GntR family transcriptional regulator [Cellulomonadaceae bacterium]
MSPRSSALVEDLARHLRRRIIDGEYAQNAPVSESGVANEYGVARPTARAALELVVADGLLLRNAYAALRVRNVPPEELPEIITLLKFTETLAFERILATGPDLREMRDATKASAHLMLEALVRASGSDRLARIHRRCTFELLLGLSQYGQADPSPAPETRRLMERLVETLFAQDRPEAEQALAGLQTRRSLSIAAHSPA